MNHRTSKELGKSSMVNHIGDGAIAVDMDTLLGNSALGRPREGRPIQHLTKDSHGSPSWEDLKAKRGSEGEMLVAMAIGPSEQTTHYGEQAECCAVTTYPLCSQTTVNNTLNNLEWGNHTDVFVFSVDRNVALRRNDPKHSSMCHYPKIRTGQIEEEKKIFQKQLAQSQDGMAN